MSKGLQLTLTFKKSIWNTPLEYKDLSNAKEIAIDLETRDDGINDRLGAGWALGKGEIVGFAVAVDGWQGYFPFGHLGGGNMIPEQVKAYMKKVCSLPCPKIFHNAQYDVGWLEASGITVNGPIIDTMIAAALIDENRYQYSLNSLSVDYLGEIKAETELREAAAAHGIDPKEYSNKLVYLMGVDKARFRNPVIPDCELHLEIEAIRSHGRVWKYKGIAKVDGKRMADAEWSATIVDRK